MEESCQVEEELLLAYMSGDVSEEIRRAIEESSVCLAKAKQLADEHSMVRQLLYRSMCPDSEELVAYQERSLPHEEEEKLRLHLQECPLCQEEYTLLTIADTVTLVPESASWFDAIQAAGYRTLRFIDAMFQPALKRGYAGILGDYTFPDLPNVHINLSTYESVEQLGSWSLLGRVITLDGLSVTDTVKFVILRGHGDLIGQEYQTPVDEHGYFVFEELNSGEYELRAFIESAPPTVGEISGISVGAF